MKKWEMHCEKCNKDMTDQINKRFEQFEPGIVACPSCNHRQARYISELDLMVYFGITCVLYAVGASSIFLSYALISNFAIALIPIGLVVIGLYFASKYSAYYIYEKAPFRKDKNQKIDEDKEAVRKRMRLQFFAFLVVALMFGTATEYILWFYIMIVLFIGVVGIKIHYLKNRESDSKQK